MDTIAVLAKDHSAVRAALGALELHFGPVWSCGWDDQVQLDRARFYKDLGALCRALGEHEALEENLVANWPRDCRGLDEPAKRTLLERHGCIDSLLKLFAAVAATIADGRVHASRTTLSRLHEELARHLDEEERDIFPLLRGRRNAGDSSGA